MVKRIILLVVFSFLIVPRVHCLSTKTQALSEDEIIEKERLAKYQANYEEWQNTWVDLWINERESVGEQGIIKTKEDLLWLAQPGVVEEKTQVRFSGFEPNELMMQNKAIWPKSNEIRLTKNSGGVVGLEVYDKRGERIFLLTFWQLEEDSRIAVLAHGGAAWWAKGLDGKQQEELLENWDNFGLVQNKFDRAWERERYKNSLWFNRFEQWLANNGFKGLVIQDVKPSSRGFLKERGFQSFRVPSLTSGAVMKRIGPINETRILQALKSA